MATRTWQTAWNCFREARPVVQCAFLLRYLAGALLGGPGGSLHPGRIALGAFGWFLATTAIYLFNGVADLPEDIRNGSTRPIADGRLAVETALASTGLLAAAGLVCSFALGFASGALAMVYVILGYAYSGPPFPLKKTYWSCTVTGLAGGMITYLAGFLAGGHRPDSSLLVFAGMMTLWMGGVGAVAKEFPDIEGDRSAGRRTWPIVFGVPRATRLLRLLAAGVVLVFGTLVELYTTRLLWCVVTVLVGAIAIGVTSKGLTRGESAARRRPYIAFMWTQHATHLVLGITVLATPLG
ncbi:UbiA family prenyltransferase [Streptosporangium saharense]|uniref:4-hydroxybenzoate polyprenyltransferase n=1 Tax=Streptosporangium saharense TaxID=1706840 RepID=A0A7W7VQX6_9ACTN|nr:UbiA family prenyltransferase [Streptosporangium saharense]MBB4919004.1 4-hydroxybenzoate polyprenyltransferase [Streptosporangium saharense]